jgi:hypothetical protein
MSVEATVAAIPMVKAVPEVRIWRRAAAMVGIWLFFGIVVGLSITKPNAGVMVYVAGAIAGMIVLSPIGFLLGLLGGRWNESLIGAAVGQVVGFCVGLIGKWMEPNLLATIGLIYGALLGATAIGLFYRLPRWLLKARQFRVR